MGDGPFQLFPALDGAVESALRSSIERFGVLVPVVRDQHGNTIDGHHRARIADEVGVKYRVDIVQVRDDGEAREIAHTLNADRRQMSIDQRRQVVSDLRAKGHSLRAIAGAVGVDPATVHRDLSGVAPATPPDRTLGRDGKRYPSTRPAMITARNPKEAERAQAALKVADLPDGRVLDVKGAERVVREKSREDYPQRVAEARALPRQVTLEVGDFREVLGPYAGAVDAIITDPPYPQEFLPLISDLSRVAAEVLKPGGICAVMIGQSYLPEVYARLGEHLKYQWTMAYLTPGGQAVQLWDRKVNTFWKPVILMTNGPACSERWIGDVAKSETNANDKRFHAWGQSESGMLDLVERLTDVGHLVCDPFVGGGTTAVACDAAGRRFVGCDVDAACVSTTRSRFTEAA